MITDTLRPWSDAVCGDEAGRERRSSPRVRIVSEEAAICEAASLLDPAGRRMSRSCGPAACQPYRRHVEPVEATDAAPTDYGGDESCNARSVPLAPRMRRSTPTVRPVPVGRSDHLRPSDKVSSDRGDQPQPLNDVRREEGLFTPTTGRGRGRRACSLRRSGHRCLRRALSLRFGSIPRGRPCVEPGL